MWYEALIPLAIIGTCLTIPLYSMDIMHNLLFDSPRRMPEDLWEYRMFARDIKLGGPRWTTRGLENIPDE